MKLTLEVRRIGHWITEAWRSRNEEPLVGKIHVADHERDGGEDENKQLPGYQENKVVGELTGEPGTLLPPGTWGVLSINGEVLESEVWIGINMDLFEVEDFSSKGGY